MTVLEHHAQARNLRTALTLTAIWGIVLCLWVWIDLAPLIAALLLATTIPAAMDFAFGRSAWLRLGDQLIEWKSGRASGEVALARIDHVRFETRLDLSVRVRLVLENRRITLPQDALPPWKELQAALDARGIPSQRHHFSLL